MHVIIVESPTKAQTFQKILLSKKYLVIATYGHIRDLAKSKLSVDTDNHFTPTYVIPKEKQKIVTKLKKEIKKADQIYLATDSDREGEAIAYHVAYIIGFVNEKWPHSSIKKNTKLKRITFHEITKDALVHALNNPTNINISLVDSQQARRILDRIVGYKLSPLLWKKTGKRWLSAGRVQTVALRIINEREKEIKNFKQETYIEIEGVFKGSHDIRAILISKDGILYEQINKITLFSGEYTYSSSSLKKDDFQTLKNKIMNDLFTVSDIDKRIYLSQPPPPYSTSLLQQDCSRILGLSSRATMTIAQELYERGLITYHRTDSFTISEPFIKLIRKHIEKEFGLNFVSKEVRRYKTRSKTAQEAHEAIRPTSLDNITLNDLEKRHSRVYKLIYNRTIATQMIDCKTEIIKLIIRGKKGYEFVSSYDRVIQPGYKILYKNDRKILKQKKLPSIGDKITLEQVNRIDKTTQPPPRYNEASLIKLLEEKGIGRPSTYAPTLSLIQERKYVEKKEKRFYPTLLGSKVCDYLSNAFNLLFSIDYTSRMEEKLDLIAENKVSILEMLEEFYEPFIKQLNQELKSDSYVKIQENTNELCPKCGKTLVYRYSKFGKFISCSGYPTCTFSKPYIEKTNKLCPKCGNNIVVKYTKNKRKFFGCSGYPACTFATWKLE